MDQLRMETPDLTKANIDKLAALFPTCITETRNAQGQPKKAVNFKLLQQLLSDVVLEGDEAFEFTWVGKKAAIVEANRPIRKTLRPCPTESTDWDNTQNLYIEGDNLEVLKLLQESYLGQIRIIYADPPYNTGNDFLYRDHFAETLTDYEKQIGMYNEAGDRMFKNTDVNGRFHSDWCSMMYARLMLARNLLTDDGAIFVSIDEHEHSNLLSMMNEIFGEENYVDSIVWDKKSSAKGVPPKNMMVNIHEYLVVYQKSPVFQFVGEQRDEKADGFKNPDHDPRGPWRESNIKSTTKPMEDAFTITDPDTGRTYTNTWAFSRESLEQMIQEKRILWKESLPKQKEFLYEMTNENKAIKSDWGVFDAQSTTVYLKHLIPEVKFDNPKPISLMKYLIRVATKKTDLIMDLFSGSCTTAHAVMEQNFEDVGTRSYIMVQFPETIAKDTEGYKAGYINICEIGKERIRRTAQQIAKKEPSRPFDSGFRVLKLDDSNMTDVYYSAGEYSQSLLSQLERNIKPDRTNLDLLFGCLLAWGLPLSLPYRSESIEGFTVHTYHDGDLIACFDEHISLSVLKEIAKRHPCRVVFCDSSFLDSPAKINMHELFRTLSPDTKVKVL